jgi:hypothetical protein
MANTEDHYTDPRDDLAARAIPAEGTVTRYDNPLITYSTSVNAHGSVVSATTNVEARLTLPVAEDNLGVIQRSGKLYVVGCRVVDANMRYTNLLSIGTTPGERLVTLA